MPKKKTSKSVSKKKSKPLDNMASSAFNNEETKPYAIEYLAEIRGNWKESEKNARKSIVFLISLALVFELFQRSIVQEISIGPVTLNELSFIHKAIPILIMYYFYSICNSTLMLATYRRIHTSVLKTIYPSIAKNEVEKFLTPPYFFVFGDLSFIPLNYKFRTLFSSLQYVFILVVVFFLPIFIEFYAFYCLFNAFGYNDIVVIISLVVSIFLFAMSVLLIGANSEV